MGAVEAVEAEKVIGTSVNVPGFARDADSAPRKSAPADRRMEPLPILGSMKLSRPVSWFLLAFGVWSWFIWITFVKNLWQDGSGLAFDDAGDPTAYFWVHLLLAVVSFLLGTVIGVIGFRGVRALRRETPDHAADQPVPPSPSTS
ncbi:hypothetical protein GCM10012285_19180 [Streptomyces kronopolitis]|uniref:Integral membrane protein n=2 Tax=Streptomyces TaxID=1883 RepID=A0ABQ2J758_9ACTN|nr:hypothetical protein GCM10012285_19180 [Streptomyces kronopolitis]